MHASHALFLSLLLASPCDAPRLDQDAEPSADVPAAGEPAPAECAYLARRRLKLEGARSSIARADSLLALGREYLSQGIGGESLMKLRGAEELYFAGFDAATWSPDAARFSLARAETARMMKLPKEALAAYARAVVLAGDLPAGERAPGSAELDAILVELDALDEREAVLAAARDDLVERQHAEILRSTVDRPAPPIAGDERGAAVTLYWFWSPRDAASRAELERVLALAARWRDRGDLRLVGVLLPEPAGVEAPDEPAEAALARARAGFPQVQAEPATVDAFLVLDRPAAALVDARGVFRYASAGAAPLTIAALERAAEGLAAEAATPVDPGD